MSEIAETYYKQCTWVTSPQIEISPVSKKLKDLSNFCCYSIYTVIINNISFSLKTLRYDCSRAIFFSFAYPMNRIFVLPRLIHSDWLCVTLLRAFMHSIISFISRQNPKTLISMLNYIYFDMFTNVLKKKKKKKKNFKLTK